MLIVRPWMSLPLGNARTLPVIRPRQRGIQRTAKKNVPPGGRDHPEGFDPTTGYRLRLGNGNPAFLRGLGQSVKVDNPYNMTLGHPRPQVAQWSVWRRSELMTCALFTFLVKEGERDVHSFCVSVFSRQTANESSSVPCVHPDVQLDHNPVAIEAFWAAAAGRSGSGKEGRGCTQ